MIIGPKSNAMTNVICFYKHMMSERNTVRLQAIQKAKQEIKVKERNSWYG